MNAFEIERWNKSVFNPLAKVKKTKDILIRMLRSVTGKQRDERDNVILPTIDKYTEIDIYKFGRINDAIVSIISIGNLMCKIGDKYLNNKIAGAFESTDTFLLPNFNPSNFKEGGYYYIEKEDEFRIYSNEFNRSEFRKVDKVAELNIDKIKGFLKDYLVIATSPFGVKRRGDIDPSDRLYDIDQLEFLATTLCDVIEFSLANNEFEIADKLIQVSLIVNDEMKATLARPLCNFKFRHFSRIALYAQARS